jgi:hypothetical protein
MRKERRDRDGNPEAVQRVSSSRPSRPETDVHNTSNNTRPTAHQKSARIPRLTRRPDFSYIVGNDGSIV